MAQARAHALDIASLQTLVSEPSATFANRRDSGLRFRTSEEVSEVRPTLDVATTLDELRRRLFELAYSIEAAERIAAFSTTAAHAVEVLRYLDGVFDALFVLTTEINEVPSARDDLSTEAALGAAIADVHGFCVGLLDDMEDLLGAPPSSREYAEEAFDEMADFTTLELRSFVIPSVELASRACTERVVFEPAAVRIGQSLGKLSKRLALFDDIV
jgi:hypothetical protein